MALVIRVISKMADSDVEMQEADTGEADEDVSMRDVIAVGAPHIHVLRAEETTPTTNNDGLNVSTSASSTAIVSDAPGSGTQNETGTSRRTINENLLSPTTPIKFTSPFLDPRNQVKQSPEGSANSDPPPLEVDPDNQRPRSVSMSERLIRVAVPNAIARETSTAMPQVRHQRSTLAFWMWGGLEGIWLSKPARRRERQEAQDAMT
ncbi:hypothetical protein TREMEDRAFT_61638 [Tremella mesenterica DSM 1558]|uniref:uncharacterized protein n=1 Tax=Tremella mesenterica (strain ATCC 24925 / CBS 8224 / DSM 1558 / NBRC 9311 / NRRL Y-6157 / RJB 2259-6 / UBC 559-6) TaxID=578456 RepID=UPI0003F4A332|nr:uncharacterized protein TREMEDRAFT_61638 [Tremella mesenterica DSM 1558]EIW69866.1 hypothetical protein TREMEDRAFT_61638 [Tremella mesenterica DSM 1558]